MAKVNEVTIPLPKRKGNDLLLIARLLSAAIEQSAGADKASTLKKVEDAWSKYYSGT